MYSLLAILQLICLLITVEYLLKSHCFIIQISKQKHLKAFQIQQSNDIYHRISDLSAKELRESLRTYNISTRGLFEKEALQNKLEDHMISLQQLKRKQQEDMSHLKFKISEEMKFIDDKMSTDEVLNELMKRRIGVDKSFDRSYLIYLLAKNRVESSRQPEVYDINSDEKTIIDESQIILNDVVESIKVFGNEVSSLVTNVSSILTYSPNEEKVNGNRSSITGVIHRLNKILNDPEINDEQIFLWCSRLSFDEVVALLKLKGLYHNTHESSILLASSTLAYAIIQERKIKIKYEKYHTVPSARRVVLDFNEPSDAVTTKSKSKNYKSWFLWQRFIPKSSWTRFGELINTIANTISNFVLKATRWCCGDSIKPEISFTCLAIINIIRRKGILTFLSTMLAIRLIRILIVTRKEI